MRSFRDITEAKETVVFGFGRFNPSTIGHEAVIEKIASVAKGNPFFIYPSHTTGPKDPLKHSLKIAWMRKMFPKYKKNIIVDNKAKTVINIAEKLYKDGYKNLILVAGSDRVKEFDTLLQRYNDAPDKKGNQLFKFDSVKVVSAGERDPDAEGVAGMSASKLRKAASDGKFDDFKKGIPDTLSDADKKKYYFAVRKGMGIRENREMGKDFDSLRDEYLTGKLWNVGDIVEANDVRGEVVRKGTNYLSFVAEDGKVHKAWLHDILIEDITKKDLNQVEKFADRLFAKVGIDVEFTRHFMDRVNDARNKKPINTSELTRLFKQSYAKYGKKIAQLGPDAEAVINDMKTDVNMPFVLNLKGDELELVAKTVMRKKDFKTSGPKMSFEEVELDERDYKKEYANYQGTPDQIARRSSRNKARRAMGDKAVKGMDVGHADNDPMNNDPKNLRMEKPSDNRREPRLREKRDAGYPDESVKIGKKHWIIYKDGRDWYGFEVDKGGNQIGDAIFDPRKSDLKTMLAKESLDEMSWYKVALAKISQLNHPKDYEKMLKRYMSDMKKPELKNKTASYIAARIANDYRGQDGRKLVQYINKLVDDGKLPKELKAEIQMENFKDFVDQINEGAYGYEKQDPDIKGKDGTQPAKYHKGLSKDTKKKRDAHFKAKKTGPAPGDADAETKPSVHTKKFKDMFGENATKGLKNKADKSGVSYSILKKVYDRGLAAYKTGHRPGTTAPQWAMARVNSFLTGGGARKADNDLWKSTKKEDTDIWNLQDACWQGYKQVGMKKKGSKEVPNCVPEELGPNATQRDYIDDFIDSDAPQFKGKDKKKRVAMAIAAFRSKNEEWEGLNEWGEVEEESEYQGRKVTLNKPTSGDVKKSKVYVKNEKGTVVKVNFGDPNMTIKKSNPARRKSFRARHNCDNPGPKWKARYWSCKAW